MATRCAAYSCCWTPCAPRPHHTVRGTGVVFQGFVSLRADPTADTKPGEVVYAVVYPAVVYPSLSLPTT